MSLSLKEEKILESIFVASENDPEKPEFPANDPKFPATPTYKIEVQPFTNVWLKDESFNPTGTHKDRMAWEIYQTKNLLIYFYFVFLVKINISQSLSGSVHKGFSKH